MSAKKAEKVYPPMEECAILAFEVELVKKNRVGNSSVARHLEDRLGASEWQYFGRSETSFAMSDTAYYPMCAPRYFADSAMLIEHMPHLGKELPVYFETYEEVPEMPRRSILRILQEGEREISINGPHMNSDFSGGNVEYTLERRKDRNRRLLRCNQLYIGRVAPQQQAMVGHILDRIRYIQYGVVEDGNGWYRMMARVRYVRDGNAATEDGN